MVDMADGYVQVAPDSTGKKIDNTEVTREDETIVERQRVEARDEEDEVLSTSSIVDILSKISEQLEHLTELIDENNQLWSTKL